MTVKSYVIKLTHLLFDYTKIEIFLFTGYDKFSKHLTYTGFCATHVLREVVRRWGQDPRP